MTRRITSADLDHLISINQEIHEEVMGNVKLFLSKRAESCPVSSQLAIRILKEHGLIQIPMNDLSFNGAIFVRGVKLIPVINTSQIRAVQYFTAWHEIYHLLYDRVSFNHYIEEEMSIEERKADYFAAQMMLDGVENYFLSLPSTDDFLSRVFQCMSQYQAPYKSVLIQLYQYAVQNKKVDLADMIRKHYDESIDNMPEQFHDLGLDEYLVMPSGVINCNMLKDRIKLKILENPDVGYHRENQLYLDKTVERIRNLLEERT